MKITLINRSNAYEYPGGDTVQIHAIAKFLQENGYYIRQDYSFIPEIKDTDLILVFNLTNIYEAYLHSRAAVANSKPYILFPIYWDLDQVIPVTASLNKIQNLIRKLIPGFIKEPIGGIRFLLKYYSNLNKLNLTLNFWDFLFASRLVYRIVSEALLVCPNSEAEKYHLLKKYPYISIEKICIIKNGYEDIGDVRTKIQELEENWGEWINSPFICCIGGIGPRKNQLNLVKAAKYIDVPLVIVGKPSKGCEKYYEHIKRISGDRVIFTGPLERKKVYAILSKATVHIQPSYIETPGLASLEAAALGCQIVVADTPPVREYFRNYAFYCNPSSIESIASAVQNALNKGRPNEELKKFVKSNYQWKIVLHPLLDIIQSVKSNTIKEGL